MNNLHEILKSNEMYTNVRNLKTSWREKEIVVSGDGGRKMVGKLW